MTWNRYRKRIAIIGGVIVGILLILAVIFVIRLTGLNRSGPETLDIPALLPSHGEIPLNGETLVVASNDEAELRVQPSPLRLVYVDKVHGREWPLHALEEEAADAERTLLNVEFMSEEGDLILWDAHTYSVAGENYTLEQLDDGIRITMHLSQGASTRFDDYMPRQISEENFEAFFVEGLKEAKEQETISAAEYQIYQLALKTAYRLEPKDQVYFLNYVGTPPVSTGKRLIEISHIVGYTYEQLVKDNESFGIMMEERETPEFAIPLELTLDGADLVARIATDAIENKNAAYVIQDIRLLPNLMSADGSVYEDGYLLVPDGAGALLRFNSADPNFANYRRQFRDSNYYADYYFAPVYQEPMTMPVYGMIYGHPAAEDAAREDTADEDTDEAETGEELETEGDVNGEPAGDDAPRLDPEAVPPTERAILAIVEDGAVLGGVQCELGNLSGDAAAVRYNRIYTTFDVTQFARVRIDGPYSENDTLYLVDTGMQPLNYRVRYKMFGEGSSYFEMATAYREHLRASHGLPETPSASPHAHIKLLGAVDIRKRFLGVPYRSSLAMTSYEDLAAIAEDLGEDDMVYTYTGAWHGGLNQKVLTHTGMARANGRPETWRTVRDELTSKGGRLSLDTNISRADPSSFWVVPGRHAITDYDNNDAYVYQYNNRTGYFEEESFRYVRLSPRYFEDVVTRFLSDTAPSEYLTIGDLTTDFFADYNRQDMVSAYEADVVVRKSLEALRDRYRLILTDPFMDYIHMGEMATSVSRESSDYGTFCCTVPFRQLVMHTLVPFSTEAVNLSEYPAAYFELQVAELGAVPEYYLSAESSEIMKELQYQGFYATGYEAYREDVHELLEHASEIRRTVGSDRLTGHRILDDDVYMSTYENGTRVIVNYGDLPYEADGITCEPMGFRILTKEGKTA